jgi:large subunit ribosomal protein L16
MKIPKKTKNKKYHRLKRQSVKYYVKKQSLAYGYWGLKSLQSGRITEKQIEAVRQSIMKKIRPSGKLWIRIFPDIPITSKPVGVRMGKGKGAVDY